MAERPSKYNGTLTFTDEPEHIQAEEMEAGYQEDEPVESDLVTMDDLQQSRPFYLDETFPWTEAYASRRNYVRELLHICNQTQIFTWRRMERILDVSQVTKVADGVYSEIFVAVYKMQMIMIKLIPIGSNTTIDGYHIYSFREAAAKVVVSKELTKLSEVEDGHSTEGFVQLRGATFLKGNYPAALIDACRDYEENGKINKINPFLYPSSQNYLLLSIEEAGLTLEDFSINDMRQAYSIMYQLFIATAAAEYRLSYEHRDLNIKNVLVSTVEPDQKIRAHFNGYEMNIYTHGVKVKIISSSFCRMTKEISSIYFDWTGNEEDFMSDNDSERAVFQTMRKLNKNAWRTFLPMTNLVWLEYIVDYTFHRLQQLNVGNLEERLEFRRHFNNLDNYADAWNWVNGNIDSHMKKDIIKKSNPRHSDSDRI